MIEYTAPPTCGKFMQSVAFFRLLAGPVGSGKTTAMIFEMLRRSIEQQPGKDGIRRTRWAIVRTTLSQLKMTILLDILHWLRPIAAYKVSEQLVTISFNDIVSEWYLIPLEDEEDQKRLLSMQLTGAAINEAIETDPNLVAAIMGRCGRFPTSDEGGPSWFGIIADTNFPIEGSPWHLLMEDERPPDWAVFKQPGGLEPDAENLEHLPGGRGYYERLARGRNADWIKRYVHAQYGEDPSGTAVYRESFRRSFHTAEHLDVLPGRPLLVGQDFGRNPCSLIGQVDHRGRLLVFQEVVAEDIGLENHVGRTLKPMLFSQRFAGRSVAIVGDPAGGQRSSITEETCFDVLARLGLPSFPAGSNDIDARHIAVEALLLSQRDAGPAIIIDRGGCPQLVRALNGAYRYAKTKAGQSKPVPEKTHPWSDLADCLQYMALSSNTSLHGFIMRRLKPRTAAKRERVAAAGWT